PCRRPGDFAHAPYVRHALQRDGEPYLHSLRGRIKRNGFLPAASPRPRPLRSALLYNTTSTTTPITTSSTDDRPRPASRLATAVSRRVFLCISSPSKFRSTSMVPESSSPLNGIDLSCSSATASTENLEMSSSSPPASRQAPPRLSKPSPKSPTPPTA